MYQLFESKIVIVIKILWILILLKYELYKVFLHQNFPDLQYIAIRIYTVVKKFSTENISLIKKSR